MIIESIPVARLNPAPYNPRLDLRPGDPDYDKLLRSIGEFGLVEPLVWNRRSGNLVGGHQRLKVLLARGETHVQVSVVDLPPEREKALNIALNKVQGDWDPRRLGALLDDLAKVPGFDLGLTGFDLPDIRGLIALHEASPWDGAGQHASRAEDFDVEAAMRSADDAAGPAVTKPGDLIVLGKHRLLCGDSTDPMQVRRVMDGERAVLFATDPPYLVGYDGMNHPGSIKTVALARKKNKDWSGSYGVTWDDADANPALYERFIAAAVQEAILPGAAWYCWHASRRQAMVEAAWEKFGAFVHQQIIWAKDRPILSRSWYAWQHEPCFFGWVRPNRPPLVDTLLEPGREPLSTVWRIPTVAAGQPTEHPTSKPLEVFEIPMRQHTRPGELCFEPFAGSGSQIIAAERCARRCFAIEISPRYCDVIVRRWLAFVGPKAPQDLLTRYTPGIRAPGNTAPGNTAPGSKAPGSPAPGSPTAPTNSAALAAKPKTFAAKPKRKRAAKRAARPKTSAAPRAAARRVTK